MTLFTETLESRTMLSADPSLLALSAQVRQDHLQIQADLLKFKSDVLSISALLQADVLKIKADHAENATTLAPLIAKYRSDIKAMWSQLKIDRLTEKQNVLADESVIVGDLKQIALDRNNPTALTTDRAKLLTDRIKLQTDMVAGLNTRLTTRQNDYNLLAGDLQAIVTAAQSDPNASPQLVTDLNKAVTDKTNGLNTMMADLTTLIADRTQLINDLSAMQSS